jgi:hypothetical protein
VHSKIVRGREACAPYRIHECNFGGAAPGLCARCAGLEAAEARATRQRHVAHIGWAEQTKYHFRP